MHLATRHVVSAVLLLALFLTGCGPRLSSQEADQLIRETAFMRQAAETKLVLYRNKLFGPSDLIAEHSDLAPALQHGLLEVVPNTVFFGQPVGAKFVLSAKGRAAAAGWRSELGPGGEEAWAVPTGTKQLVSIVEMVPNGKVVDVRFAWRWVASELGRAEGFAESEQTSSVQVRWLESKRWFVDETSIR
jgi:hypothetical protein